MSPKTSPIPEGYHSVTPYLIVDGAAEALEFYRKAFNAAEIFRMEGAGGKVLHAEIQIGDSRLVIADEFPEMGARCPAAVGGTPVALMLYVENVDQVFEQALRAGARQERPLKNQFYGERSGTLVDPYGHSWTVAMRLEDVPPEELDRRATSLSA